MPKAKPTQVITHRIEMGEWERQNIGKPVATASSNAALITSGGVVVAAGALAAGAYAVWKFWEVFDDFKDRVSSGFDNFAKPIDPVTGLPQLSLTDKIRNWTIKRIWL